MIDSDQTVLSVSEPKQVLVTKKERLSSLLKWAGGKEHELRHILPLIPPFARYYEPFVGGGAVFFAIQSHQKYINDRSSDLINFYTTIACQDKEFFEVLDILLAGWQALSSLVDTHRTTLISHYEAYSTHESSEPLLAFVQEHDKAFNALFTGSLKAEHFCQTLELNLLRKIERMRRLERSKWRLPQQDIVANIESAFKSAFYMHLRHLYNTQQQAILSPGLCAAIFFFVRENAYASMFRYNSRGEFNVPYGGISYNRKDLGRKVNYLRSPELQRHLKHTIIENMDFEAFLQKYPPAERDFIFLDPPYDSEFSTYSQNAFERVDHERLAAYLLQQCKAQFMLVIKNTPAIFALYNQNGLTIQAFDKKYRVSFQDRNNRDAEHLIITNF